MLCNIPEISQRGNYSNRCIGRLALLMFLIAYGEILLFPNYLLKYGIGYIIPYLIIYLLVGVPLFSLEVLICQFQNLGPIKAFSNLAPILRGVGWGMAISCLLCSIYFTFFNAACLVLTFRSIKYNFDYGIHNISDVIKPIESFIDLQHTSVAIKTYELLIGYIICWVFVILCNLREFQRSNKVIVFFNVIPYFLIFLVICLKVFGLPNEAIDHQKAGLWEKLTSRDVPYEKLDFWIDAFKNVVYDLGLAFGTLGTLASYNRTTANCINDAFLLPLVGLIYGFCCLFLVYDHYTVLENPSFLAVLSSYCKVFSKTAASMIYLKSFIKGMGSMITKFEMLLTAVFDEFPFLRKKHHAKFVTISGLLMMLAGTSLCMIPRVFQIILTSSLKLHIFIALILALAAPFASLQYMHIKEKINLQTWTVQDFYVRICWILFTPLILVCAIVSMVIMEDFDIVSISLIVVVLLMLIIITAIQINLIKMKNLFKPTPDFCTESQRNNRPSKRKNPFCNRSLSAFFEKVQKFLQIDDSFRSMVCERNSQEPSEMEMPTHEYVSHL